MLDVKSGKSDASEKITGKKTKIKVNKPFILGLILGVFVTAAVGLGLFMTPDLNLFPKSETTESSALLGGPLLQVYQEVTRLDFETKVLNSAKQELVLVSDPGEKSIALGQISETMNMVWEGGIKVYYVTDSISRDYIEKFRIDTYEKPIFALFQGGKLIAQKKLFVEEDDIVLWLTRNRPHTPTPVPVQTPTPEPPALPVVYRTFPGTMFDDLDIGATYDYFLSEISLTVVNYDIEKCTIAGKGKTLPLQSNTALFALIENHYGGDSVNFGLPDLSGQIPLSGLTYQIRLSGVFPPRGYEELTQIYNIGDIKYMEIPFANRNRALYLGEIILAKNLDEEALLDSEELFPCDGRELSTSTYAPLYSITGNRFGGNGSQTFRIPDLSNITPPIEGAKYYIVMRGLYPPGN